MELRESVVVGMMAASNANTVYKIQRQLFARSERVKGIDFHPVEPWILTTLYSGMLFGALVGISLMIPRSCIYLVIRDRSMSLPQVQCLRHLLTLCSWLSRASN